MNKLASLLAGVGAAVALAAPAHAVDFVLESHVGDAWTYTLVYDPFDNMSFAESGVHPTITLTGLSGVTAVSGPTSTDFPNQEINDVQLQWTGSILDGGATVVFANLLQRVGTGNYSTLKHVYGFTLTAPGAVEGEVGLATNGFYYGAFPANTNGGMNPANDRDIAKTTAGPVAASVPEPATWAMMILGFAATGGAVRRRRAATPA
ncbi:MAG: PEPxxWA-CTERM sorting domain-containing protein [Alphaproteobacteria bacterium]|nr:PEPxxWA-CTERM sorting domain-containing protein [Alphaproteobacteria bacterium]MBU1512720.1 PEPxxWA-CTERM sorting domain-containing protein [Alphaproteobacteria bacterium]MBU2096099.1 PEPxxWA-CTERM sorting domain-containing protein [Alphaproteobacteria bacterium]MBU2152455.1 PEPxxWA-CTERM sorting domain-containing protein [Alphaproteobacteria bacterium]MBU2308011.1 PEPxxWA-CTERM sorting domain-containing protein [Alphaproteobacteria bacterium]